MMGRKNSRIGIGVMALALGASVALAFGVARQASGAAPSSPLPALVTSNPPALMFLIDTSGSMKTCDGGSVIPANDFVPKSGGGYLYDPRTSTADDGDCDTSSRPTGQNTAFPINRIEAVKLAVGKILDADHNGVVDSADEGILRMKIGVANFPIFTGTPGTKYGIGGVNAVGSAFASVYTQILGYVPANATPTGPALAGTRTYGFQSCYDGDTTTPCNLANPTTGNDPAILCRDFYVLVMTDGAPNTDVNGIGFDPLPIAKSLFNKVKVLTDGTEVTPPIAVKTIGVGFGSDVNSIPSDERGYINCMGYWGGASADANKDGDKSAATMATGGTETTIAAQCDNDGNMTGSNAARSNGNGWFATDANSLQLAFVSILNAITAGSYSRSQPTLNTAGVATSQFVYGAYFDVVAGSPAWHGHLRKYRYDASASSYVNCDDGVVSATPKPCWDGGGWYGGTNLSPYSYTGLFERSWTSRIVYTANPQNFNYKEDLKAEINEAPPSDAAGVASSATLTVKNVVPLISPLAVPPTSASMTNTDLQSILAMSTFKDPDHTYKSDLSDYASIPLSQLQDSAISLMFAAGKPTSTFADNSLRCELQSCTDSTASPKMGDSYNSRPVIVGPPVGVTTDPDYLTEFLTRVLTTAPGSPPYVGASTFDNGAYTGNEKVKEADGITTANPCGAGFSGTCDISHRRTMIYLAANDGSVHAFDDTTGYEMWSFIPPGHLKRLLAQRSGRTTYIDTPPAVRDVKFPCERTTLGSLPCKSSGQDPFEDGKWHTLMMFGQGTSEDFYFALDITNPVKPVFLWEFRKPDKMAETVARPAIGQLPNVSGTPQKDKPGVAVFATGGYIPDATTVDGGLDDTKHCHFFALRPYDGQKLHDHHGDPFDLPDAETSVVGLRNGMVGEPRPVDADVNGTTERVYYGDLEGRMWKACNLTESGDFTLMVWFDPALYNITANGTNVGVPNPPNNSTPLSTGISPALTATQKSDRKTMRGPIFYPPDVTHDANGNIVVAFGSGNIFDPLTSPSASKNFVWTLTDDPSNSCALPVNNPCASTASSFGDYTGPGGTVLPNVTKVNKLLTGGPLIFKSDTIYPEFDTDVDNDGDPCEGDVESHLIALDTFACNTPAQLPFAGGTTNKVTYANSLITGVSIDAVNGTLFTMSSKPLAAGNGAANTVQAPNLSIKAQYAGWRED